MEDIILDNGAIEEKKQQEKEAREKAEAELLLELDGIEGGLTPRQKRFCELYTSKDDLFGNGTRAYVKAYGLEENGQVLNYKSNGLYWSAASCASRLLKNVKVLKYLNSLLTLDGFNDANVDKQLLSVIEQHEDRASKTAAIREYNKLKARVVDRSKVEHDISPETSETAKAAIAAYLKGNAKPIEHTTDPSVERL